MRVTNNEKRKKCGECGGGVRVGDSEIRGIQRLQRLIEVGQGLFVAAGNSGRKGLGCCEWVSGWDAGRRKSKRRATVTTLESKLSDV